MSVGPRKGRPGLGPTRPRSGRIELWHLAPFTAALLLVGPGPSFKAVPPEAVRRVALFAAPVPSRDPRRLRVGLYYSKMHGQSDNLSVYG